jgi:hypothetical protein
MNWNMKKSADNFVRVELGSRGQGCPRSESRRIGGTRTSIRLASGSGNEGWFKRVSWPGLLMLALLLAGCKSRPLSPYISPRVVGRVVDARTGEPIHSVQVRRVTNEETRRPTDPPKGGELLRPLPSVRTGEDGAFVLDSVRDLALFGKGGWYSVTLSFEHARYERLIASYTPAQSTNTPSGEPLVNAGDVRLNPPGR